MRILSGHARFVTPNRLRVESAESTEEVSFVVGLYITVADTMFDYVIRFLSGAL